MTSHQHILIVEWYSRFWAELRALGVSDAKMYRSEVRSLRRRWPANPEMAADAIWCDYGDDDRNALASILYGDTTSGL